MNHSIVEIFTTGKIYAKKLLDKATRVAGREGSARCESRDEAREIISIHKWKIACTQMYIHTRI